MHLKPKWKGEGIIFPLIKIKCRQKIHYTTEFFLLKRNSKTGISDMYKSTHTVTVCHFIS